MVTRTLAGIILTVTGSLGYAQPVDVRAIGTAIAQSMEGGRFPGLSVGVMHQGKVILANG